MKRRKTFAAEPFRTWQISFNDLLTVLLTFFILLVSASHMGQEKLREASSAASRSFGTAAREGETAALAASLREIPGVAAHPAAGGVAIRLSEAVLYRSGSAELEHPEVLRAVGLRLRGIPGEICVEGHTDDRPLTPGAFASNWELSTRRAVNTVRFLIGECGIDPRRLSAVGYADSRPLASNATEAGRALNRRVNIIIQGG